MFRILFLFILSTPTCLMAQGTLADYRRAEKFLSKNVEKMMFHTQVSPHWIGKTSQFWYKDNTRAGKQFILVNIEQNTVVLAFDHQKLAAALSKLMGKTYEADNLPFDSLEWLEKEESVRFDLEKIRVTCHLETYQCQKVEKDDEKKQTESKSPDGKLIAFLKDYNLYIRTAEGGQEVSLTRDGEKLSAYALGIEWDQVYNESNLPQNIEESRINVTWSPDSKRLVTFRRDRRQTKKLYLYQSTPEKGYRAQVWSYERALPGETELTRLEFIIFDIKQRKQIPIDLKPLDTVVAWGSPRWFKDSQRLYFSFYERGYNTLTVVEIDAETGSTRTVLVEKSKTMVDTGNRLMRLLGDGTELVWSSERDGWNHLYLYDWKTGELKNQITRGEYVVRSLVHVDEKKRCVFFTASGREPGCDPYFRQLYCINLDGTGMTLLTPENAEHEIYLSADEKYVVDYYSRVDMAPTCVIRLLTDGRVVRELAKADINDLLASGWRYPEPFKVKARDGKTDIYGVIFRPSNFDPSRKYPVIDATYSGPHTIRTPKSFRRGARNSDQPLTELGFVVVTVDGLGTAYRSKPFHDFSYKNLGDIGAPDHIAAFKQLAEKYTYLDFSRVGIYGHSAGGYDATHALLTYPEFYKVGVSSSANHDLQMAKAWWPEHWMGFPVGPEYIEQSNLTLAKNLQGKLLLIHGDMDSNVNPASTLRFAGELIKANKDFDLIIIPNRNHGLGDHPYVIRKRWDHFVRYLLGVTPPKEYAIGKQGD